MCCIVFLASYVILTITSAVAKGSAALVALCCCRHLPFHDVFMLLIVILVSVVELPAMDLLSFEEATYRSADFLNLTS